MRALFSQRLRVALVDPTFDVPGVPFGFEPRQNDQHGKTGRENEGRPFEQFGTTKKATHTNRGGIEKKNAIDRTRGGTKSVHGIVDEGRTEGGEVDGCIGGSFDKGRLKKFGVSELRQRLKYLEVDTSTFLDKHSMVEALSEKSKEIVASNVYGKQFLQRQQLRK